MKRIMIIGCGGAGKSTLARKMGEKLGIPVVHLDQIWWSPGNWEHMERDAFDEILFREMEAPQWILDGNYNRTVEIRLDHCDTVVYLDMNRFLCLKNWLGRVIKNWGHARADMAPGCAEWLDPEMFWWIWNFNRKNRARYYELLSHLEGKQVVILKSRREVNAFLKKL